MNKYYYQPWITLCYRREFLLRDLPEEFKKKVKDACDRNILSVLFNEAVQIEGFWQNTQDLEFLGIIDSREAINQFLSSTGCLWSHPFGRKNLNEYLDDIDDESQSHRFMGEEEDYRWVVESPDSGSSAHAFWLERRNGIDFGQSWLKTWSWITSSGHNLSVVKFVLKNDFVPQTDKGTVYAVFYDNKGETFCPMIKSCFHATLEKFPVYNNRVEKWVEYYYPCANTEIYKHSSMQEKASRNTSLNIGDILKEKIKNENRE